MARRPIYNLRGRGRGGGGGGGGRESASNHEQVQDNAHLIENLNKQPMENAENQNDNVVGEEQNNNFNGNEVILDEEQFMNGRRVLALVRATFLRSSRVARVISKTFKTRTDPDGSSWNKMKDETKHYYFEEFRKAYYWEDGMEVRVKEAWNTKASKCYSNILSKAKNKN